MTTKIDGLPPGVPRPSSSGNAPAASGRATSAERRGAAGDVVQVSGEAAGLASLERAMAESPAFDAPKVAALRALIESGQYQVDTQQIAARLAEVERALG